MTPRGIQVVLVFSLLGGIAAAQTSTSFTLEEYTFNAGGTPSQGVELTSPSFGVTLSSIGDTVVASDLGSGSFGIDAGFGAAYPPPGEVAPACGAAGESCLLFTDSQTLTWPAEASAGVYHLYRDLASSLSGLGFGQCERQDLSATTTTDSDPVPPGDAFFYLVTVENRLAEEGTKGFDSVGTERINPSPCP